MDVTGPVWPRYTCRVLPVWADDVDVFPETRSHTYLELQSSDNGRVFRYPRVVA